MKALDHMPSGNASSGQIIRALQHMADHDSKGNPLQQTVISFTPKSSGHAVKMATANIDDAGSGDATNDSSLAPASPAAGSKDMATLIGMLNDATGGPTAAKKAGRAPAPTQVAVIQPGDDPANSTNYSYLVQMGSMIQLYTSIYDLNMQKQRGAKQPNGITDPAEAAQAFADQANAAYQAIKGPLAGLYEITSENEVDTHKNMHKTEIHFEFLQELFQGFSLRKDALDQLDGVLTKFVSSIGDLNITSSSEDNSINQALIVPQVARINVSGDDSNPSWIHEAKTRLIYMKVDSHSWSWATTSKHSSASDSGFDFKMHNIVVDATLNVEMFLESKDKLDQIMIYLTGKNLEQYGKQLVGTTVKTTA